MPQFHCNVCGHFYTSMENITVCPWSALHGKTGLSEGNVPSPPFTFAGTQRVNAPSMESHAVPSGEFVVTDRDLRTWRWTGDNWEDLGLVKEVGLGVLVEKWTAQGGGLRLVADVSVETHGWHAEAWLAGVHVEDGRGKTPYAALQDAVNRVTEKIMDGS